MADQKFALVDVSPEMVTVIGHGEVPAASLPHRSAMLCLELSSAPRLTIRSGYDWQHIPDQTNVRSLALVVQHSALKRLFSWSPAKLCGAQFHLPHDLVAIAERIWQDGSSPELTQTYRLAKSIELLCDVVEALQQGTLLPFQDPGSLTLGDSRRLLAAKQMIEEEWSQKLTLGQIARRCGLNRTKLSRGFRELFNCTVSEALLDRRLEEARRQLLSTDLPIGVIGYRNGYLNNASFTRAFGRRFGVPPSDLRNSCGAAA